LLLNLIRRQGLKNESSALNGNKQFLLIAARSSKPWSGELWPVSLKEKEFGDGNP
jgi:hypothetical protein